MCTENTYLYASLTEKELTPEHPSLLGIHWNSAKNLPKNIAIYEQVQTIE